MTPRLHHCDARHIPEPNGSVQCVVTSPPYWGLRSYDLPPSVWGGGSMCEHEWGEGLRIHKGGPHGAGVLLEGGRSVVSAQAQTKDIAAGSFCSKCDAWLGCLGLEPTPELFVAHMVEVFEEVRRVLADTGVVFLNLGDSYAASSQSNVGRGNATPAFNGRGEAQRSGSSENAARPPVPSGLKPKDLVGIPWRVAFALQAAGWWLRSDIVWHKPNPMPESVTDRPTKAHEFVFLLTKSADYFYDAGAIAEPSIERRSGNSVRKARADHGGAELNQVHQMFSVPWEGSTRNARDVWTFATQPTKVAHFATMPEALVARCVLAGSRPGDVVLDPFVGSGTVARVASRLGREAVGCDLNERYLNEIAAVRARVRPAPVREVGAQMALPAGVAS